MCSSSLLLEVDCHIKNGATSEVCPSEVVLSLEGYYLSSTSFLINPNDSNLIRSISYLYLTIWSHYVWLLLLMEGD